MTTKGNAFLDPYTVLALPRLDRQSGPPSAETVRRAYHAALLAQHPDKQQQRRLQACDDSQAPAPGTDKKDVRAIIEAYRRLAEQGHAQHVQRDTGWQDPAGARESASPVADHVDALDLDDMDFDPARQAWRHACRRCGAVDGFSVGVTDLDDSFASDAGSVPCGGSTRDDSNPRSNPLDETTCGRRRERADVLHELLVPCSGCSLQSRVVFSMLEDTEGD